MQKDLFKSFEKCANYSVISVVVFNTINTMTRFKNVSRDRIITNIFDKIKSKAASVNA